MKEFFKLLLNNRFRKVFFLFLSFVAQFWWLGKIKRFTEPEIVSFKYSQLYAKQALRFTDMAIELGGLLIKLGQFFSSRVDILPKEYTNELAKLQDAVTPLATEVIIERIEEEYGKSLTDVFANFSKKPLAAASLGQVHKATLQSGDSVVVKTLRPGVEGIVAIDLQTLKVILTLAKRFTSLRDSVDLDEVYREFRETINDELSYIKEADNAKKFSQNLSEVERVYIPKIYRSYSTDKVLVMEYISGTKINEFAVLDGKGLNRSKIAETLFAAYLKQILTDGFFHADPHPGNLLVKEDGTLAFIDFGMVGQIDPSMKENIMNIVMALAKKDAGSVVKAFRTLGFIKESVDSSPIIKSVDLMIKRYYDEVDLSTLDLEELLAELRELMYSQPFQLPAQTTFLGKSILTLTGICYGLDENFDLVKVGTPYVNKLLPDAKGSEAKSGNLDMILDQAKNIALDVIALPEKLNRLVSGLETGELRIRPAKSFENNLYQHQAYLANRIVNAIMISSLGIVGAILYNGQAPEVGLTLLGLSGLLGLFIVRGKRIEKIRSRRRMGGAGPGFKKPRLHP